MRYCGKQPHLLPQRPSAVLSRQGPHAKCTIWKFDSSTRRAGERERPQDRLPCECWEGQITWAVPLVWKSEEHVGWVKPVWSTHFLAVRQSELTLSAHYFFRYADVGFASSCTPCLCCSSSGGRGCSKGAAPQAPSAQWLDQRQHGPLPGRVIKA